MGWFDKDGKQWDVKNDDLRDVPEGRLYAKFEKLPIYKALDAKGKIPESTDEVLKFGTLYLGDDAVPIPTKPFYNYDGDIYAYYYEGDVAWYANFNYMTSNPNTVNNTSSGTLNVNDNRKPTIRDTVEGKEIQWYKVSDNLYICDRNLMNYVSWEDLRLWGYVEGTNILIDGVAFRIRLLTGSNYVSDSSGASSKSNGYYGGYTQNEWDTYIGGAESGKGPITTYGTSSLYSNHGVSNYTTAVNGDKQDIWHWWGTHSWCQEVYGWDANFRATRGYSSPIYYQALTASNRWGEYGWRPALEMLEESIPDPGGSDSPGVVIVG